MKIVGLMIARDEELCCGMTIETAKDVIDELVFVDNMSKDRTAEIVRERCEEYGIKLHEYQAPLTETVKGLRGICLAHARELKPEADWFLNMDADTVFSQDIDLRALAESGGYEEYWFQTMNMYGDMTRVGGINQPHLWLFKNSDRIAAYGNYVCTGYNVDPNKNRFIAWNLNGLHYVEHMFWRYQIWYQRLWNSGHGVNLSVDEFIEKYFGGKPTDYYIKTFILNRMRNISLSIETAATRLKMTVPEFESKYRNFPRCFKEWDCPFSVTVDADDRVDSRSPDILEVPVLGNEDIRQLTADELDRFRKWRSW